MSSNNICYELRPKHSTKFDRENLSVASLNLPRYDFQERRLKSIRTTDPIASLKEGVYYIDTPYKEVHGSRWGSLFAIARDLASKRIVHPSEEISKFLDRLFHILDAQKVLDAKNIIKYERVDKTRRLIESREDYVTVKVIADEDSLAPSQKKVDIASFVREVNENSQGRVELGIEESPYARFDSDRAWGIDSYDVEKKTITFRRKIASNNKGVPEYGFIRPNELSLGVNLHMRKRFGIIDLKDNNSLLDTLIFPESVLFSLGLPDIFDDGLVNRIHNTIPMFLVQGPPGTGKTWLASKIVETILAKEPTTRILLSCHDHEPLDNLLEAVSINTNADDFNVSPPPLMMRMLSTDKEAAYTDDTAIAKQFAPHRVTSEILKSTFQLIRQGKVLLDKDLLEMWKEEIEKNKESPSFEWIRLVKRSSNVVFSTATSGDLRSLDRYAPPFDWVIIEEAGKAYITELILPMNLGQRWLLIGDQRQLPPYKHHEINQILSRLLEEKSDMEPVELAKLKETLARETKYFDDVYRRFGASSIFYSKETGTKACERLQKQWRMPPKISDMISTIFYEGTVFESMKSPPEEGKPFKSPEFISKSELVWINTPYCTVSNEAEQTFLKHGGHQNSYETKVIGKFLESIVPDDIDDKHDLAIITPYKDQRELLKNSLKTVRTRLNIEHLPSCCFTVDSYQGRQADVIIISMVRNNTKEDLRSALGFITAEERLNVLFSRAKMRIVVVGCIEQFEIFKEEASTAYINKIIDYFRKHGRIIDSRDILDRSAR
ncbi:MAG: DEAD/DEAH box helicase [Candidatus Odinarchaeota archaeon]